MDLEKRTDLSAEERALLAQRLQIFLLDAIARTSVSEPGAMMFHGGTAISTCYGSPRWSEDLDFVLEPNRLSELNAAIDASRGSLVDQVDRITPGADVQLQSRGAASAKGIARSRSTGTDMSRNITR